MLKQAPINMNAKRSIALIVSTLLRLMEEKPFKDITISAITKHAGIVRNTFYAHFESKEDVLTYHIYTIFNDQFKAYAGDTEIDNAQFVPIYFNIWSKEVSLLQVLEKNDLLSLLNLMDTQFEYFCYTYFAADECDLSELGTKYANAVYADMLASILKRWIRSGMEETPEEMSAVFLELLGLEYMRTQT